jgi:hypothetical protein
MESSCGLEWVVTVIIVIAVMLSIGQHDHRNNGAK